MSSEEFTKISYKRKSRKNQLTIDQQLATLSLDTDDFDITTATRRVLGAKEDIHASDYYTNVQASVREALSLLHIKTPNDKVNYFELKELVCFGIGHVSDCMISRYQLALVLLLKEVYDIKQVKISDPILSKNDLAVLEHFNVIIIHKNIEAKYAVNNNTLFYLPHCPKQLSNNLLWANWSKVLLRKCVIFSNSFQSLLDSNTKRELLEKAELIWKVSPFVKEIAVFNTFKYYEIFNDGAVHVFPDLSLIVDDLWQDVKEPKYLNDVEYIAA